MGFCSCTSKFILFLFNLVCALLGLAVLGVGVYAQVSSSNVGGTYSTQAIVIIVFGGAVTLISFFGCWGAIQENRCFLNTYGVILTCLLIGLIAIGAVVIINKSDAEKDVKKFVIDIFENAKQNDPASVKEVDTLQGAILCCGLDGPEWWNFKKPPPSCYSGNNNSGTLFTDGCVDKADAFFKAVLQLLGSFAIVTGCIEFAAVFLSFFLANSIKRHELRSYS